MASDIKKNNYIIFALFLFLSACGYKFSGGGSLPAGIQKINISTFTNKTSEIGIENIITDNLIYEFTRSDKTFLSDQDKADGFITGTVKSLRVHNIARRGATRTLERKVTVNVSLTLKNRNGKTIRFINNKSDNEIFEVALDKMTTELNRRQAVKELSSRLAEKIFNSLTENF